MYSFALFLFLSIQAKAPELRIEGPPEFAAIRARLESLDPQRLADIARLLAMNDAGAPIRVVLAGESSDFSRRVAPWVAGFAVSGSELVVIFPARSPGYPHDSLDDVLRHEVAHVLIERAAAGRAVPRWFNEGVAMSVEHARRFQDQTELLYQLLLGSRTSLDTLDRLFAGDQRDETRAYALAGAFVDDLLQRYGSKAPGEILMRVAQGASFETAFTGVIGKTPATANLEFWERQRIWTIWAPIVTSSGTLWLVVTLLALLAIYRHRQKNAAIEKRWEEEDESSDN
jgi:hypothetical protein